MELGGAAMTPLTYRSIKQLFAAIALTYLALVPNSHLRAQAVPIIPTPAKPLALTIDTVGTVPGFDAKELAAYLSARMATAGLPAWRFQPGNGDAAAPNRIEWRFRYNPYAEHSEHMAGMTTAMVDRLFGLRHVLSIEARLYVNGEYQTLTFTQTKVKTNGKDAALDGAVAEIATALLGPNGAYFAIDMAKPAAATTH